MPRIARSVFAGVPHHVTQRGNRREQVFFTDADRQIYLQWLIQYADKHGVEILAYCLMPNHVHLVAVPSSETSLQRILRPLHMRYAQHVNHALGGNGHVWQGRYFSSALDDTYLWAAIRYVERNPLRARLVRKAENYPWSSAVAHCGLQEDPLLTRKKIWLKQFAQQDDWSGWLAEQDEPDELAILRRNADKGLPCGSERFIRGLEKIAGRSLEYRPRGRQRKPDTDR